MEDPQAILNFFKSQGYASLELQEKAVQMTHGSNGNVVVVDQLITTYTNINVPDQEFHSKSKLADIRAFFREGKHMFGKVSEKSVLIKSTVITELKKSMIAETENAAPEETLPEVPTVETATPVEITGEAPTPEPTPTAPKAKRVKKAPEPKEKRVSALGTMREMIVAGKAKEEILDLLVTQFPLRTRASLSGQLSSTISATKKASAAPVASGPVVP